MSCEHAETTTLLWLYGEGDEAHATHVVACPECRAVVADHETVWSALDRARVPVPEVPEPANRPWVRWALVGAMVAAAVAVALLTTPRPHPAPVPAVATLAAPAPATADNHKPDLDHDLDQLDGDMDALAADLHTL